jgi:NADH dehydrogenase
MMSSPRSDEPKSTPHVVVLGGGFAGLLAARRLIPNDVRVTLIDRRNHHVFQPLLYQVAAGMLNPSDIAAPIRRLLRAPNVTVLLGEATSIDLAARQVALGSDVISYDYLLIATGSAHAYFGHPEWAAFAPGLKTLEDALEIRRRVLFAFEAAEREPDPQRRLPWLTFVVIGGGPTGVELAGALAEISHTALARDFHNFDPKTARIVLVEGAERVLTAYPENLSQSAVRSLSKLGVEVRTATRVTEVNERGVQAGSDWVDARTVLWAAGVAISPIARTFEVPKDRAGRIKVTPFLTVPGHDEVFVAGDLAYLEQDGQPIPGLAPAAMQEGKHAARNILRALHGQPMLPFRYWDRGSFAVIGRGSAVGVAFKKLRLSGFLAWLTWLGVHIFFLIGFRNRIAVLFNWAYSFFTLRGNAQLITGEDLKGLPTLSGQPGDAQLPSRIASVRRSGSAAPHSN